MRVVVPVQSRENVTKNNSGDVLASAVRGSSD